MNLLEIIPVAFDSLGIQRETISRFLGYGGAEPGGEVGRQIRRYLAEAAAVCRPLFGYRIVQGRTTGKQRLELDGVSFHPGSVIAHALKGCDRYIILAATAGDACNDWMHQVKDEGDMLHTYIADAIGSAVADATAQYAERFLAEEALLEGWRITNSYSPGYCDWNVSEQQQLFGLLPSRFCGISLNDSCLMNPIKSISSVMGLGANAERKAYSCDICKRKDCFLRKSFATD